MGEVTWKIEPGYVIEFCDGSGGFGCRESELEPVATQTQTNTNGE
jgi:hypothetical protein